MVQQVCTELAADWEAVDVDADPAVRARYTDHVPVTLVDGEQVGIWVLEPEKLRAALLRPAPERG